MRPSDLQDNFSKTQAVERIYDRLRQHPDNTQREFAQQVQQDIQRKSKTVEQLKMRDEIELSTNLAKENTREKSKNRETEKKEKEEEEERGKSTGCIIDITI